VNHSFQRRARRAAGVAAAALLALPLAAQAADYRAQFSESFNSGLAGARPAITFRTVIDNGSGGAPVATGILRYTVDTRHLTSSAWASMLAATPGTQLGTFTSELTGASAVRVLSHGRTRWLTRPRPASTCPAAPRALHRGRQSHTIVVRRTASASHLTFVLDIRRQVGGLIARGAAATLQTVTLALRSSIVYGGKSHGITLNPAGQTALTNSVATRACADATCATVAPAVGSSATVHLPKTVTLAAPVRATYGYRYSIGGTGRSGDDVSLDALGASADPGSRGDDDAARRHVRDPRNAALVLQRRRHRLELAARGRYAVASVEAAMPCTASPDRTRTSRSPGRASCCCAQGGGHLLHFSIRIRGRRRARVAIRLGGKTLVTGYSMGAGRSRDNPQAAGSSASV
jgi:hypothetical protein